MFPPVTPSTDQVTPIFVVPVTVAVNCWVVLTATVAVVGEMVTVMVGGGATGVTVTMAFAVLVESAFATAVTVTCNAVVVVGAVYKPEVEIVPVCALPPATPFTCQVTPVSVVPVTAAWNCCVPPAATVAEVGEIVIATVAGGLVVPPPPSLLWLPPPQAVKVRRRMKAPAKEREIVAKRRPIKLFRTEFP